MTALDNQMAATAAEGENITSAAAHQPGDECLSPWEGSIPALVGAVKSSLSDPDSFQHLQTRLFPVSVKGGRSVIMEYRAKNRFGGIEVARAFGVLDPANCQVTLDLRR